MKSVEGGVITLEVKVDISGSVLAAEGAILSSLNEAGCVATGEALKRFDTDGPPIATGGVKGFSKGQLPKTCQTPYGETAVERHVYQRPAGGETFCPLERDARVVVTPTPRFAKLATHKMANGASTFVQRDLAENHGRAVSRSYLPDLAGAVGGVAQAREAAGQYETPKPDKPIKSVAIGRDGTCMLLCEGGCREAMTGAVSLYDQAGERRHTIYPATPGYGKATFQERMTREIAHIKRLYPKAAYVGIADGARTNRDFLQSHVSIPILDCCHATQYPAAAAPAAAPDSDAERIQWLDDRRHDRKHKHGAATRLPKEMEGRQAKPLTKSPREQPESALTCFRNPKRRMRYARCREDSLPIGSGVTEAACKTPIKQRLCCSGMKWVDRGARIVWSLRALVLTPQRWDQFWNKVSQYGLPVTI